MKIHVLEVVLVVTVAALSWLLMFSLENYFGNEVLEEPSVENIPPFPNDVFDNIFWFLQISDIHFSVVDNLSISDCLELFCHDVMATVNPSLVIVSGDLTHAKFADQRRSQQFSSEWRAYHDILQKCNLGGIPWLDIRGNHDDFNVPSILDQSNYFLEFSMSWKEHGSKSYCYSHRTPFGVYNFIALDVCPTPGPKRPYNFFGVLHTEDIVSLRRFSRKRSNHTLWFTHYPSAIITTDHRKLQQLMRTSVAHVCGHLHTLGGFVPQMYGRHPGGHLELELGDFRHSKRFRLLAFDHDLFSFTDTTVGKWPLVLVTNPKNAKFLVPAREPTKRMLNSTHIRILVFSTAKIVSVKVEVDGLAMPTPTAVENSPLYVLPWRPYDYAIGLHNLKVIAKDGAGRVNIYTQPFSLDSTLSQMDRLPQLLLLTNFHSLFRLSFLFIWLAILSVLVLSWINQSERSYFSGLVRTKAVFYPYFLFLVYFGIGPWYVGEILTDVYGFVCVHGVYVMGTLIPGSLTYLHGTMQMLLIHVPLVCYINHALSRNSKTCHRWKCHCVMFICVLMQLLWVLVAYPYGYIALILSPGVTWPLVLTIWMIYNALKKNH